MAKRSFEIIWRGCNSDLYSFNLVFLFLLLLFFGLGVGNLLCVGMPGKMGEQGIYAWSFFADIWFRRNCSTFIYAAVSNKGSSSVFCGHAECDGIGIYYGNGDGTDLSCAVLGLQQ